MHYDVIVIGGGHAGIEAAWAAARTGASVALITMDYQAIGRMSCNPAIGGVGKGQMVREIDALGGLMGLAADRAGIQFRMLNRRKGPAVWAPRAQADRNLYPRVVQELLSRERNITIIEGVVESLEADPPRADKALPRITAVRLVDGRRLATQAVVVTTGTFLRGLMHCGEKQACGGRIGEQAATGLSASLQALGITLGRLKTGTPPRVHRDSVDYSATEVQPGDQDPTPFSFMTDTITQPQVCCWITYTNPQVHEQIRANIHRAPMYSGQIRSSGPRYCPSIEDKVVRFADKSFHQVFLEPEGYDDERIYCNGISTSLPIDVQEKLVHGIRGLERVRILQHGYAVEYDFVPTHQTTAGLRCKLVAGLFLAGQINGTSGYEEAAGQGLVAGVNAVRWLRGEEPFTLGREQAYIGVMIDDLITRPPTEPYRMFTSRAEYRLRLRGDNADQRLTPMGRQLGLVDEQRWQRFTHKREQLAMIRRYCHQASWQGMPLSAWLRRPQADVEEFSRAVSEAAGVSVPREYLWQVLMEAKYDGYLARQDRQVDRMRRLETMILPATVDYSAISELRSEAREQLHRVAPRTLGQASRITGITPADIMVLWIKLRGGKAALPPVASTGASTE